MAENPHAKNANLVGLHFNAAGQLCAISHSDDDEHPEFATLHSLHIPYAEYATRPVQMIEGKPVYHELNKYVVDHPLLAKIAPAIKARITNAEAVLNSKQRQARVAERVGAKP